MDKIGIILLNYNAYEDTKECLDSLKAITYSDYEIFVVDNDSQDGSADQLKQIKGIHFIESGRNGGFGYGNNIGIKAALKQGCQKILLLNNDTTVEPDFLTILNQDLDDSRIGIIAPKILNYYDHNKIWALGGEINWPLFVAYNSLCDQEDHHQVVKKKVDFISGCCMLIRSEIFEEIGYLPEDYFMYFEDLDFCLQVSSKYELWIDSQAVIYHKVSAASGEDSPFQLEWVNRSQFKFMKRYGPQRPKYTQYRRQLYLRKGARIASYLMKFDYSRAHAIYKGIKKSSK